MILSPMIWTKADYLCKWTIYISQGGLSTKFEMSDSVFFFLVKEKKNHRYDDSCVRAGWGSSCVDAPWTLAWGVQVSRPLFCRGNEACCGCCFCLVTSSV